MAVLVYLELPGASKQQYDQLNESMGIGGGDDAPEGLIDHVCGAEGDRLVIVDVWESEEAFGRFAENQLRQGMEQLGVGSEPQPRILPVHNRLEGKGGDPGVIMMVEIEDLGVDGYDEMTSKMDAHVADGSNHPAAAHTAARANGGVMVVDLWESPEAFGQFAEEQIGPAGAEVGVGQLEPRFIELHNRIRGR